MEDAIARAARCVAHVVELGERTTDKDFSEGLLLRFSDQGSEVQERLSVVSSAVRATELGEVARVYVDFNDMAGHAPIRNSLTMALQPYFISRRDLILKEDPEGFKICRRNAR
jgi:hypothetical protein